jgi:hypothetical protein
MADWSMASKLVQLMDKVPWKRVPSALNSTS